MALTEVTAPAVEPVSLAEAKLHLRVDAGEDDALITALIVAARRWCEQYTRRTFVTTTWDLFRDGFPASSSVAILLPRPPVQSVTSVKYIDSDGVEQTWDAAEYRLDKESAPARLTPAYNQSWPTARTITNAVEVRFIAGYGDAATDVEQPIIQAMLLLLGHLYDRREASIVGTIIQEVPLGIPALLWPYRVMSF